MKKSIKISLLILFSFFSFFISSIKVEARDYNYDYIIEDYDITITVNEDNSFNVEELITTYFNSYKHGIYRNIPLKNTINRLDGTTSTNRARISDVSVNHFYNTSKSGDNYQIKIGSSNSTVIGRQIYSISYKYHLGKDPLKDIDELYYNIIGTGWDTVINNVSFRITMPKDFDKEKIGFSYGSYGSTENTDVVYSVYDNVITGRYHKTLYPGDALTIRIELDEGYFNVAKNDIGYLIFIIPFICLVICFLLWYKYGKDNKVIETVEFYPPEGFNSLEIAFLYKGKAENDDVVSLLVYLADKGYIKISEIEEESLFSKTKTFSITKLKDYDGNNIDERTFLDGLFKNKNTVTESDLTNCFYTTVNAILSNINSKTNKNKIFEKTASTKNIFLILSIIISLITIIAIPTIQYGDLSELSYALGLCLFYIPFYVVGIVVNMPLFFRIFWLGFIIIHSFMFYSTMPIADALIYDQFYRFGFIFGLICVVGMSICLNFLPKRTTYGNHILGKIRGFKHFLETVEKTKLENMVFQDPSYFYHILPYTYVLGISDKWIEKFESISLGKPDWYDSSLNNTFDFVSFRSFMDSTMITARHSMISRPSSSGSSGGFSSGGGSSGGGSGGGGGGSW